VIPVEPAPKVQRPDADILESWIGRQGFGWAAVILLLFATAFFFFLKYAFEKRLRKGAPRSGKVDVAVLSLLPWLGALLLLRARPRPFVARFTETAVEVEEPPLEVPYASMQGLLAPRRPTNPYKAGPPSYLIQVIHTGGVLCIPARLNVPSDEVFSFLLRQFTPSGSRDVPNTLADFLRRKERAFGPERVWTYRARPYFGRFKQYPGWSAFFAALTLTSGAWLAWGIVNQQGGWIAGGFFGLLFGIVFSVVLWAAGRQSMGIGRGWRQAGLVIAPDGLALSQGDMIGQLRWDEVRDVKVCTASESFRVMVSTQNVRGIVLKVEGAVIVIADIFDRPLALIHQHICHYWRGGAGGEDDRGSTLPSWTGSERPADSFTPSRRPSEDISPSD
jgi:hypothetical protein